MSIAGPTSGVGFYFRENLESKKNRAACPVAKSEGFMVSGTPFSQELTPFSPYSTVIHKDKYYIHQKSYLHKKCKYHFVAKQIGTPLLSNRHILNYKDSLT